jgi:hypothetical protein
MAHVYYDAIQYSSANKSVSSYIFFFQRFRQPKPEAIAEFYLRQNCDPDGLQVRFIDKSKGT